MISIVGPASGRPVPEASFAERPDPAPVSGWEEALAGSAPLHDLPLPIRSGTRRRPDYVRRSRCRVLERGPWLRQARGRCLLDGLGPKSRRHAQSWRPSCAPGVTFRMFSSTLPAWSSRRAGLRGCKSHPGRTRGYHEHWVSRYDREASRPCESRDGTISNGQCSPA